MTTILYCHDTKQIAVDSRLLERTRIVSDCHDKTEQRGNHLFFFSGSTCDNTKIIEAYFEPPSKWTGFSFAALVLNTETDEVDAIYSHDGKVIIDPITFDEAVGSGAEFALAGLDYTGSVVDALEYVKTKDAGTGGRIRVYSIDQKKFLTE